MSNTKKITTIGLIIAIITISTFIVRIPIPGGHGYINFGDSIIFLTAFLLPAPLTGIAAGIGSGFSDLFSGFGIYILPTFFIKFAMGYVASKLIYKKSKITKTIPKLALAGLIMVIGYFIVDIVLFGTAAALGSIVYNLVQYVTSIILGSIFIYSFDKTKAANFINF